MIKITVFYALLLLAAHAFASTQLAEKIVEDYQIKADRACEKLNATLENASTEIAVNLTLQGNTDGAAQVSEQVKLKLNDQDVLNPNPAVVNLFQQYDAAKLGVLKPLRQSALRKLDNLVRGNAGKDMANVLAIGKAREIVEGTNPTDPPQPLSPRRYLSKYRFPKVWGYFQDGLYISRIGILTFHENGTFNIQAAAAAEGIWKPTLDPSVIEIEIKVGDTRMPNTKFIIIKKDEATMKRYSGQRYLRPM